MSEKLNETAVSKVAAIQLADIAKISKHARMMWFVLILVLIYCGITLVGVKDRHFFELGGFMKLPLRDDFILTKSFFWVGPMLVTGLYTCLHLYLFKLWKSLRRLGPSVSGRRVAEVVHPSLFSEIALSMQADAEGEPRWRLARIGMVCLCWLAAPLTIGLFWFRSWAPHDEWLTALIGLQLVWILAIGVSSWTAMRQTTSVSEKKSITGNRLVRLFRWSLLAWTVGAVGWAKTEDWRTWVLSDSTETGATYLYSAHLEEANFRHPDIDWEDRDTAWRAYQQRHRDKTIAELRQEEARNEPPTNDEVDARLKKQFRLDRREKRNVLKRFSLIDTDFRNADLRRAFMIGIDLSRENLEGANLTGTRMEGVSLGDARLDEANLSEARLEDAYLLGARLERATLRKARLNGADLRYARLEGADLSSAILVGAKMMLAKLQGVNFTRAILRDAELGSAKLARADLTLAQLDGAILRLANMADTIVKFTNDGARNLTQEQLNLMYGDGSTPEVIAIQRHEDGVWVDDVLSRPKHWPSVRIPEDQRIACWKEWAIQQGALETDFPETDVKCTTHADSK